MPPSVILHRLFVLICWNVIMQNVLGAQLSAGYEFLKNVGVCEMRMCTERYKSRHINQCYIHENIEVL